MAKIRWAFKKRKFQQNLLGLLKLQWLHILYTDLGRGKQLITQLPRLQKVEGLCTGYCQTVYFNYFNFNLKFIK